jgi:allantoinase
MQLPHHGRYDYSAITKRPDYSWPEGKRLAIYFALNIEHFAFGAGVGHALSNELPPPDSRTFAWRDYGNRVGVWRLYDLLEEYGLPACHLVNTAVFDYCPEVIEPHQR